MKIFYTFIAFLCLSPLFSQDNFTLNEGNTDKKKYFTVIDYKEVQGKIIVQCTVNDKPYNFIVDTGAPVAITQEVFNQLNPQVINTINVSDQSGKLDSMKVVSLARIKIGDITFTGIPAVVMKNSIIFDCYEVNGILGSNMLRNSVIRFSDKDKKITLTDSHKNLNLKRRNSSKMGLSSYQSNPYIEVRQESTKVSGKEIILFDSGMSGFYDLSVMAYEQFKKVGMFENIIEATGTYSWGLHGLADSQTHYKVFIPEFSVNNYVFKDLTVRTTHDETSRIGSEIFKHGDVTLDYRHKRFYFEPYKNGPTTVDEQTWSVEPTFKDDKLVIGLIWDKSLEERVNPGDEILKMGNLDYSSMSICEIMVTEREIPENTTTIVLKDVVTGEIKEVQITKDRLQNN